MFEVLQPHDAQITVQNKCRVTAFQLQLDTQRRRMRRMRALTTRLSDTANCEIDGEPRRSMRVRQLITIVSIRSDTAAIFDQRPQTHPAHVWLSRTSCLAQHSVSNHRGSLLCFGATQKRIWAAR